MDLVRSNMGYFQKCDFLLSRVAVMSLLLTHFGNL